jgi:hypothetical protein
LLVVQNAGDQQCIGANREGSELLVLHDEANGHSGRSTWTRLVAKWNNMVQTAHTTMITSLNQQSEHEQEQEQEQEQQQPKEEKFKEDVDTPRIAAGAVAGLSNSVFSRPWRRVQIGVQALEAVLNKSLERFGTGHRALKHIENDSTTTSDENQEEINESIEMAWLVIEMLTLLKIHTKPYPEHITCFETFSSGIRDRVFIPRTGLKHLALPHVRGEYGTRSSTVVLFGRSGRAVFVEKNWYGPLCPETEYRQQFDFDSTDGVIWWQGQIGRPRDEWTRLQRQELEDLFESARSLNASSS